MGEVMTDFMTFEDWIQFGVDQGGFETDDILASVLPLMRQTLERHEANQVAPFCGTSALKVSQNEVWFHQGNAIDPSSNRGKLKDPSCVSLTPDFGSLRRFYRIATTLLNIRFFPLMSKS